MNTTTTTTAAAKRSSTLYMVELAMMIAIILLMSFTPLGYLRTPGLSITLLTIPVAVGAIILGPKGGAVCGLAFGATSFYMAVTGSSAFAAALFNINPFGTFIVCIVARVLDMSSIKPVDVEAIRKAAEETGRIITVEEHSRFGGLGAIVVETLSENPVPVRIIGIPDENVVHGNSHEIFAHYGLDKEGICKTALEFVKK